MAGLKQLLIATVLAASLSNVTPVSAVGDANFSGTSTWGETPDGSAVYVCVEAVVDGLNLIVSYPLGPTQTTAMWGPADGDRPAGFKGGPTSFTIWHPYSATEVRFELRLTDIACSSAANLPDPGPEFGFESVGSFAGLVMVGWGLNCENGVSYIHFLEFGTPGTPGTQPAGLATFEYQDWGDDNCPYDFDGNFPDLEYYQQRAAAMEEASALPDTV